MFWRTELGGNSTNNTAASAGVARGSNHCHASVAASRKEASHISLRHFLFGLFEYQYVVLVWESSR